jgi:hypothetical protein
MLVYTIREFGPKISVPMFSLATLRGATVCIVRCHQTGELIPMALLKPQDTPPQVVFTIHRN